MRLRSIGLRIGVAAATILVVGVAALLFLSDGVRWRVAVVGSMAAGRIDDIGWGELLPMLKPGSGFDVQALSSTRNPYVAIRNPYVSTADREVGESTFAEHCAACHGARAEGQTAPTLVGRVLKWGDSDWSLFRTVNDGIGELGMPAAGLSDVETWRVVGFLRGLRNGSSLFEQTASRAPPPLDVSSDRLEHAISEPNNWLTYSGSYRSWRHTALDEINVDNVSGLKLAWALQLSTSNEFIEASPLVVDGVMYLSVPPSDVLAVDAATGKVLWRYSRQIPKDLRICCGIVNRGVAVLGNRVYFGTPDAHAIALDARTGRVVWETQVADYTKGFAITVAPLAVRDKVVIGVAGGEFGIRGFLDAYDATTGMRAWRFYTVPEPGQAGSETWNGEAWKTGGGPTWVTGSFDPALGLLYWGVGNPAPDYNGDIRPGDNLYTNSVIALDVDSGELKWHFQFTPHDERDWDANQVPVLIDHELGGTQRRLMLWANRNGFYYVLDRVTGEFLHGMPFVKQNWAAGLDAKGRPIVIPENAPSKRGTLTWPGVSGGGNWWSPSYSPQTDLIYVPFAEAPKVFIRNADLREGERRAGTVFLGSAAVATDDPMQAGIRALNPVTGERAWEYLRKEPRKDVGRIGGALATAGNVVFFGDVDELIAVAAVDGRELWRVRLGGEINASPISFAIGGQQRVAIPAGNTIYVFRP